MGFGRACAPVRCAHPSFSARCHAKQGAARPAPDHRSFSKIYKIYRTWAAHVKGFFLSTGPQRLWNMRSPAPAPPIAALLILPAIFWGQNYVPVRPYAQIFVGFSFFIQFLDLSFCTYLLFLLSFLISSYSSLLILRLLILLLFNRSLSFWGFFWRGQAFFDPFGVKINVYTPDATILFFSSYLFLLFSSYSSRSIFFLFLFLSSIFKQFVVLNVSVLNTHWEKVHN